MQDASAFGGYGGYGGQSQGYQQGQNYRHHYPPPGGQGHEAQQRLGGLGYQQQHQRLQQQEAEQRQMMQSLQWQMAQTDPQHRAEMAAVLRGGDAEMAEPSGRMCGARLSEVSASTAEPNRMPNQHIREGEATIRI